MCPRHNVNLGGGLLDGRERLIFRAVFNPVKHLLIMAEGITEEEKYDFVTVIKSVTSLLFRLDGLSKHGEIPTLLFVVFSRANLRGQKQKHIDSLGNLSGEVRG